MRKIEVISTSRMERKGDSSLKAQEMLTLIHQAQENGNKVILAAIAIERQIDWIIQSKLFPENELRLSFFTNHVLNSESFNFSFKRKLILQIIKDHSLLSGGENNSFTKILSDIITWRNAFAHGQMVQKGDETFIGFSKSGPSELLLSDYFWSTVEKTFEDAYTILQIINLRFNSVSKDTSQPNAKWPPTNNV